MHTSNETDLQLVRARGAYALYCDDVRVEDNGKLIVVGAFNDAVVVPEVPALLPTFAIYVSAWTPMEDPFQKFKLSVHLNDEVIAEEEIPVDGMMSKAGMTEKIETAASSPSIWGHPRLELRRILKFSPLLLEKVGALRVRITTEREIIPAGGVRIQVAVPDQKTPE